MRVPSKRLARDLVSSSMMVIGEVVLCLIFSVVRTARGDVAVLGGSAACDAAVAAAGALTTVFFAQNARELAESLILVEMLELRSIVSVVRVARGDVTMRGGVAVLGGSAACDAAVTAAGVLTTVFFAQNARELAESLVLVEMLELRSIVSVVRAARDDVTMRGGFAACGPAEMFFLAVVACVR